MLLINRMESYIIKLIKTKGERNEKENFYNIKYVGNSDGLQ